MNRPAPKLAMMAINFLATGEAEIRSSSMIRGSILSLTIISWRDRLSQKPKFQTNASFITCLFFFFKEYMSILL